MTIRTLMIPALAGLLTIGCGSEEELRRVELEVGDLKLEVFKLRQQGLSMAQVSESLGVPKSTIYLRLKTYRSKT